MICEYCLKPIRRGLTIMHLNVSQPAVKRHFCKKACKEAWMRKVMKSGYYSIKGWRVAEVGGKPLFVKGEMFSDEFPVAIATKLEMSHFYTDLKPMGDEELLELIIQKSKMESTI